MNWFSKSREITRLTTRSEKLNEQLDKYSEENESLIVERRNLKEEVEDLKLKKKIEQEDIEHLVKMKMERNEIKHEKKVSEADANAEKKIAEATKSFNDKLTEILKKQIEDGNDRFEQILNRLPDVQVNLGDSNKRSK